MLFVGKTMREITTRYKGFTIVELLVVIVVLGVIATIAAMSYGAIQEKTRQKKIDTDLKTIISAVRTARSNTGKNLKDITGSLYTASPCVAKPNGTDLATLPASDPCISSYKAALDAIAAASGTTLDDNMRDPWGRPYLIDENEGELGNCYKDTVVAFARPLNGSQRYPTTPGNNVPLGSFGNCS